MNKWLIADPPRIRIPKPGTHIPALDGLRGLAILLVMFSHFILYGGFEPMRLLDRIPSKIGLAGWVGVDLFFVLSGFLITGILFDTKQNQRFFRNFYMRRTLRIFPLYYGVLIFVFLILPKFVPISNNYQSLLNDQGWYWSYLTNISIALNGWPASYAFGHFWSLAVEEQFYLIWPIIIYLFSRRTLLKICVFTIVGSLIFRVILALTGHALIAYVFTPARMDTLATGAFLALAIRGSEIDLLKLARWAWPVAGFSGAVILIYSLWKGRLAYGDMEVYTAGFSFLALLFGAILLISITVPSETSLGKFFNHPTLRFFGRYSYALYVFHHPISIYLPHYGFSIQTLPTVMNSQIPALLLFSMVAGLLSIMLALLSWHLFEARFLSMKRYFEYASTKSEAEIAAYKTAKI
jgi:peptidoglycan/LPS O-acetylase OafA/YrhL